MKLSRLGRYLIFLISALFTNCQSSINWETELKNTGTYASPRVIDLNNDQVLDIIVGAGGTEEWEETPYGVLAINGKNGELLWNHPARNQVVGCPVFIDLTNDGIQDVIIGGRSAQLKALDGKDGKLIWEYLQDNSSIDYKNDTSILNFFTPQLIEDLDLDGYQDILISYGGFVKAQPWEEKRPSGYLMIFSALKGDLLARAPMPDGKETYMTPVVDNRTSGTLIYFGSGGETVSGNFYVTTLNDLLDNHLDEARVLTYGEDKGFIAPPVLIDINGDQVLDPVINSYEGKTIAIDGANRELLWQASPGEEFETHSQPAPGFFTGNDSIYDFFINYGMGTWPEIRGSLQCLIDGSTGKLIKVDSLGGLQYGSPMVLKHEASGYDHIFFTANEEKSTNYSLESGKPQHEYTNSIYVFDPAQRSVRNWLTFPGTCVGSTILAEDLDGNGSLEFVYLHNQNPYDPFLFTGLQINCFTHSGYQASWSQYLGKDENSIYTNSIR